MIYNPHTSLYISPTSPSQQLAVTHKSVMANNSSSGGVYDSDYYDYYNLGSGDDDNGYKEAEKYIWIVGGVTLLVVGTFGNLLALAVLTRPKMR